MSDKSGHNREALLKMAKLVQPALSTQDYIPALKHICFEGKWATAFNDISAIMVKSALGLDRCVPGDLLIRALGSFSGSEVSIQPVKGENALLVSSGRSKVTLPCLTLEDFPFELPVDDGVEVVLSDAILSGIERCLISVSTDQTHPAQMGVTLDAEDGKAVLYSTDNFTISRAATKSKLKLPGDCPVILPTFFCNQLLTLGKAFPEDEITLSVMPGALIATVGKSARLLTKTLVDLEPLDFAKIVAKNRTGRYCLAEIPAAFDAAISRAILVLSNETDKATEFTFRDDNSIELHSKSALGHAEDDMQFSGGQAERFLVDPTLVARGLKGCTHMAFFDKVMMLGNKDESFLHLISHCTR